MASSGTSGRHAPFYAGVVAAAIAFPFAFWLRRDLAIEIPAILFFLSYLLMTARRLPKLTGAYLAKYATDTDEPVWIIFAVTLCAVGVSVVSLFAVLNGSHAILLTELVLAFLSVALGWLTIHTMAAIHYAHLYWRPAATENRAHEGLDFPATKSPSAYDFLYFAFVIGMTAQTSDVAITSTGMRKVNLLHAVVSFFFNTVLVAAAVNAAVSLAA
jgi:uncharacterized membrane protein